MGRETSNSGRLYELLRRGYGPEDERVAELRARTQKELKFKYPDGKVLTGRILRRWLAWSRTPEKFGQPRYLMTCDAVQFAYGVEYRLGYYRVFPGPRLVWGAQTSACFSREEFAALGVMLPELATSEPEAALPAELERG
jgi:hypothetical protein